MSNTDTPIGGSEIVNAKEDNEPVGRETILLHLEMEKTKQILHMQTFLMWYLLQMIQTKYYCQKWKHMENHN
jgi:hypothetical protein